VASTEHGRDEERDSGVGFRFYLTLAGAILGIGVLVFIGMIVFWRAVYAWGFLGAFLALAAILLLIGWMVDRRDARLREG
jgi:hypothetical protein